MAKTKVFLLFILLTIETIAYSNELIKIKIGFLESFDLLDSAASQRYENAYRSSIYYAVGAAHAAFNGLTIHSRANCVNN